jgi:hypothetical protein
MRATGCFEFIDEQIRRTASMLPPPIIDHPSLMAGFRSDSND